MGCSKHAEHPRASFAFCDSAWRGASKGNASARRLKSCMIVSFVAILHGFGASSGKKRRALGARKEVLQRGRFGPYFHHLTSTKSLQIRPRNHFSESHRRFFSAFVAAASVKVHLEANWTTTVPCDAAIKKHACSVLNGRKKNTALMQWILSH